MQYSLTTQVLNKIDEFMSSEKEEGKIRKEYGKTEEKIDKDMDDPNMKMQGKADKEYGKAEEKIGKKYEKERGQQSLEHNWEKMKSYKLSSTSFFGVVRLIVFFLKSYFI